MADPDKNIYCIFDDFLVFQGRYGKSSMHSHHGTHKSFLARGTSYDQDLLLAGEPDGVSPNRKQSIETLHKILRFAESEPIVYLPSHNPDSASRLKDQDVLITEKSEPLFAHGV